MKPKTYRTGLLALGASLLTTSAWAATITVGPSGEHASLQAAVAAATAGDTISLSAGTHSEPAFVLNKAVTISGPNAGLAGTATRGAEARISDTSIVITAAGAVLDGVEIYQNVNTNDAVQIQAAATVQNTVFRREGSVPSDSGRGIVTTSGVSGAVITNNFFTGDNSANVFGNHKTWQSGIYVNGGSLTISSNTFEKVRAALNLDDLNPGVNVTGNSFRDTSGTYISLGGVLATTGSHTISGNDFGFNLATPGLPSAFVNNSKVDAGFRINVSGNTIGGVATGALTSAHKFAIEGRMYHRGRSGRIGTIDYITGQQIQVPGTTLQSAVNAASAGDTVLIGGNHTLTSQVTVSKQLTLDGVDKTTSKLSGSAGIGYFLLFNGTSAGSTVRNLSIEKTDKATQNIVGMQAANLTFNNLSFTGQYVFGEGDSSRAFEVSGNANGFTISNSSITGLRQPAYINAVTSGTVQDNFVAGTRGWVVDGGLVSFTGNTWGQGVAANAVDIALLLGTPYSPLYDPLSALSANNNGATISNQRTAVQVYNRTANSVHATIQAAINAATAGDDLEIYPGTFNEAVTINKPVDLIGSGSASTTISSAAQVIAITTAGSGSSVKGLKVTGGTRGFNLSNTSDILLENVVSTGNSSSGININGANSNLTLRNSSFSNNTSSGIKVESSANVANFLVEGTTVNGNSFGLYAADGNYATFIQLQGLTLRNSSFSSNFAKGIFIESMSDGLFEGLTVANSGQGTAGNNGSGIDINLKHNNYSNLTIRNSVISGCGANYSFGGGLLIKARNDGSYAGTPATLGGTVLVEGVRVENNGAAGNGAGIRIGDSPVNVSPSNVVIRNSTLSGNNNFAVLNLVASSTVAAANNHWGTASGPIGATTNKAGPNVNYMPWYGNSTSATPPALDQLRTGVVENTEITTDEEPVDDLYVAPGKTITVSPTGGLTAEKIELAEGAEIIVNGGDLTIGQGSKISGSFTIFNSFGSWNVNGDTTFEVSQALALVTDIHVAPGKTITVNGGGELILDGCVIDNNNPNASATGSYNIVVEDDGLLTLARSVVSDAVIDIDTDSDDVGENLKSKVYDNSFTTSDIEASADAQVYHNLFDTDTNSDSNSGNTVAFDAIDGWSNVTDAADLRNKFTLDFAVPADTTNTLDSNGNLFVRPTNPVVVKMNVSSLAPHTIVNAEALLGFNSSHLALALPAGAVTPATGWEVVAERDISLAPFGLVDSTLGLTFDSLTDPNGISADSTIGTVEFTAGAPGLTAGFFRVQTNREFEPGGRLLRDTRLTKFDGVTPTDLTAFTANTGELVIDGLAPVIDALTAEARQVQPSVSAPVDVFDPANRVFRNGATVELTFDATDNGLSGLDASDAADDLVILRDGAPLTSGYTVGATAAGGVVTYTVTLSIPANTPAGEYDISATVQDRSGNPSVETGLGTYTIANEALASVELQGFTGASRSVTFVATGGVSKTWTKTVSFTSSLGSVILEDVPAGTTSISAKTAWTLRSKVAATFTPEGVGSATLTGTDKLLGGDINGDNVINTFDYTLLRFNFGTLNTVGDINGDGGVSTGDYNLQRVNFYQIGKGQ